MVNHWISDEHGIYWHIKFPNEGVLSNPEILITLLSRSLKFAIKHTYSSWMLCLTHHSIAM